MNQYGRLTIQKSYIVTVRPAIWANPPFSDRIELTFTAEEPDSSHRIWQKNHELADNLFVPVLSARKSTEIVASLRVGKMVVLPDSYSSFQLLELGFRSRFQKPESVSHVGTGRKPKVYPMFK